MKEHNEETELNAEKNIRDRIHDKLSILEGRIYRNQTMAISIDQDLLGGDKGTCKSADEMTLDNGFLSNIGQRVDELTDISTRTNNRLMKIYNSVRED